MRLLSFALLKRWQFWFCVVVFCICAIVAIAVGFRQYLKYPRYALLSDVRQAKKVIVNWPVRDEYGTYRAHAFELNESARLQFLEALNENLVVKYGRECTIGQFLSIYLVNDKDEYLEYLIRCDRGTCPSMTSLCDIASKDHPISEIDADEIFNSDCIRSPDFFLLNGLLDYTLRFTPSAEPSLVAEAEPLPDPRLRSTLNEASQSVACGASQSVACVAFSPDGATLASESTDKMIKLWDVASGRNRNTVTHDDHTGYCESVAFSPDCMTLASGSVDNTIKLWDVATGNNIAILNGHTEAIHSMAYSPDGKTLASGSRNNTIKLWDVASGKNIITLSGHTEYILSVAFSPDGTTLASGGEDKMIKLWDVASGKNVMTLDGHAGRVDSIVFSPDGKILASSYFCGAIKLWDLASGKNITTWKSNSFSFDISVAFSPDGKILASGGSGCPIRLWDVARGKGIVILGDNSRNARCLAFSPDGKILASGMEHVNTVKLWDMQIIYQMCK
jgi:WD40 repeat protein